MKKKTAKIHQNYLRNISVKVQLKQLSSKSNKMISITRNLDELFDYTQGLIRELQQKNNEIIIRSDTTKTATSPGILSVARNLQY